MSIAHKILLCDDDLGACGREIRMGTLLPGKSHSRGLGVSEIARPRERATYTSEHDSSVIMFMVMACQERTLT